MKATWSVGLIFGVILLMVNNPFRSLQRLRYRQLIRCLPCILLIAAGCGVVGGWLGYHGYLTRLDPDFQDMVEANLWRPQRFMCCWGVHLGGYVGGLLGTLVAVASIVQRRSAFRRIEQ